MAHPYHHALSSVKRWGGEVSDYQPIHDWLDETKAHLGDVRHRALRHHTLGVFDCERLFGKVIKISTGKKVPVRFVAEQHIVEDLNRIPTPQDWLKDLPIKGWMAREKKLSLEYMVEPKERKLDATY